MRRPTAPGCEPHLPPEDFVLWFFFADTLVKITRPDSSVVYPYYPGKNDNITVGPKRRYIDLELRVEFADSAIPNYWVSIDIPELADSGGHSHNGSRPMGKYRHPITSSVDRDTLLRQTDSEGKLRFRYVASQFGGAESITARLVSDTTKWDTLSVKTRVPGLQLLSAGASYSKIGGTCTHHGPDDDAPTACQTPDNNHYAAQIVRDSLPLMANVWVDSLGQDALFINDISLPYGGLFDVNGNWSPEHAEHREGLDVDVRTARPGRTGVEVRNSSGKWMGNPVFEDLARACGVKKIDGHKKGTIYEHYHLDY